MRKLASVVVIDEVNPIPDTSLACVTLMGKGWNIVTQKDEFQPGDYAVYFEIDSALPVEDRYEFLKARCLKKFNNNGNEDECLRIKTIRLRGVISQGIVLPIRLFPEITEISEGLDVTELLKVRHYDDLKVIHQPGVNLNSDVYGSFPSVIPRTDEERIQNLAHLFSDPSLVDVGFEVTHKDDGSSVTMFYAPSISEDEPFGICSRNYRLKRESPENSLQWKVAQKYNVEEVLRKHWEDTGCELALQGELVGPGIQSNRDKYTAHEWHVFKIWDINRQEYLPPGVAKVVCEHLGLQYVTVLYKDLEVFKLCHSVQDVLNLAEGLTARGNPREGLVFKSNTAKPWSFKAISNSYLLKSKD